MDRVMKPNIAVIGCGYWGRILIRNFSSLGALCAVSDMSAERAEELSAEYTVPALSLDQVLSSQAQGLVLATPAATHAGLAIRALKAGKHVFVEKPLALRLDDAEAVRQCADALGRLVLVGHLLRYHPAFRKLEELIRQGVLGRLQYIYSNRLNLGRIRREENVFWSFAPHDIAMVLALAGEMPDRVQAVGHCYLHSSIADITSTHLSFPSGLNAKLFMSWLHPYKEQKLIVVGTRGMAAFDDGQPWCHKLVLYRHDITWRNGVPDPSKADPQPIPVEEAEPLRLECGHFLDCIREGRRPLTDVDEGLRVLSVLDAAERAMTSGRTVGLTPADALPYFVHPSAVVDNGCHIQAGSKIWHFSHVMSGSRIGRDCVIGQNVMIGSNVSIGNRCKIQNNVSLYTGVTLEDGVFCGPSCVFTNVGNPRAEVERKDEFRPTRVGRGATIGANATIVCGHTLGQYCFIAAGAVVTRDVLPHALVAGNPARQIGWVSHTGERLGNDLVCPRTGTRYDLTGDLSRVVSADPQQAA
jgi:UDP-2-acetamido-3-amino-2,3-dideoxy-glucuronate N-acetyltransferase